jgi:hypothetical protein
MRVVATVSRSSSRRLSAWLRQPPPTVGSSQASASPAGRSARVGIAGEQDQLVSPHQRIPGRSADRGGVLAALPAIMPVYPRGRRSSPQVVVGGLLGAFTEREVRDRHCSWPAAARVSMPRAAGRALAELVRRAAAADPAVAAAVLVKPAGGAALASASAACAGPRPIAGRAERLARPDRHCSSIRSSACRGVEIDAEAS